MICDPTIEEAALAMIRARITGLTTAEDRVYLENGAPQNIGDSPRVTVSLLSNVKEQSCDGPSGLTRATISVVAYAPRQSEASRIAYIIEKKCDFVRGLFAGVFIQRTLHITRTNLPQSPGDGREFGFAGTQVDFEVWYEERVDAR